MVLAVGLGQRLSQKYVRWMFQSRLRRNAQNGIYRTLQAAKISSSTTQRAVEGKSDQLDLASFPAESIRNFCIIAHVDHGKSTLADRILEFTGAISKHSTNKQVLDKLQVERERGITVKAQTASIVYEYQGKKYLLNLIDTPGHVDFNYEVSRSLAACQGAILLVDAKHGIQAQTVANFYLAFANNLSIIPAINKIDLKNADPEAVKEQMVNLFEMDPDEILKVSAKLGTGVTEVLDAVVSRVSSPAPVCKPDAPLRVLLFDSWFDRYKGAVCLILVVDGTMKKGDLVMSFHSGKTYEVKDIGILTPEETSVPKLYSGQVGYFTANIRNTSDALIGDTFHLKGENVQPLPGFKQAKPMVFAGVYPMDQREHPALKAAIERLCLNDSSVTVNIESSSALGQGWRLGFLGLLHMDVFNQRLEQEHRAQVVITTPSVPYKVKVRGAQVIQQHRGDEAVISNPVLWPNPSNIVDTSEPFVMGTIITPDTYLGAVIGLCQERRGIQQDIKNLDNNRLIMMYKLPLNEIIIDFFDMLKSVTSGYASFDYEDLGYESSSLVKLDILLNSRTVPELSTIVHSSQARRVGKRMCEKLENTLPRHLFQVVIQAAVGGNILARSTIKAVRKDVTAKCYGGDISRKMKLLKRQAEGKKKMKMYGNIEVPREAFINILKR